MIFKQRCFNDYYWRGNELWKIVVDKEQNYKIVQEYQVGTWEIIKRKFPKLKKKDVIEQIHKEERLAMENAIKNVFNANWIQDWLEEHNGIQNKTEI